MPALIITEKAKQAKNLRAAIGTTFGDIVSAEGHLITLVDPGEADPRYKEWSDEVLVPPGGRYATKAAQKPAAGRILPEMRRKMGTATEVIIACDCDREGTLIGREIVDFLGYRGPVKRVVFSAEDPKSLRDAFADIRDFEEFRSEYEAGIARSNLDQIFNLTMTRVATNNLRQQGARGAIGIGRVKTPTMGIVAKREMEIRAFVAKDYFTVKVDVRGTAGMTTLTYAPREDARITRRERADAIAAAARAHRGPIAVAHERKSAAPPRPLDIPSLQKKAGKWGWSPKKVMEVAQALYDEHQVTTYPRAECRYLPEALIPQAEAILAGLRGMAEFAGYPLVAPVIRTGPKGAFSDAETVGKKVSHHAIIPNVNNAARFGTILPTLSADEKRLFDLIARTYLAAISEDYVYDQTTLAVTVPDPADATGIRFGASGSVPVSLGWKVALGNEDDEGKKGKAAEEAKLPPFRDGDPVAAERSAVEAKRTEPPPRYTMGDLISEMQDAWKHCEDKREQERLKAAKGIGMPATRDTIIETLFTQGFFELVRNQVVPTESCLELFTLLREVAPSLLDPAMTARMEMRLDEVQQETAKADDVIRETADHAARLVPIIVAAGRTRRLTAAATADRSFVKGARPEGRQGGWGEGHGERGSGWPWGSASRHGVQGQRRTPGGSARGNRGGGRAAGDGPALGCDQAEAGVRGQGRGEGLRGKVERRDVVRPSGGRPRAVQGARLGRVTLQRG